MGCFIFCKENWREKKYSPDGERNGSHCLEKEDLKQHFPVIQSQYPIKQILHDVTPGKYLYYSKTFSENDMQKYQLHSISVFLLSCFLPIFLVVFAELHKMPLIKLWKFSYSNLKAVTRFWVFASQIRLSLDLHILFLMFGKNMQWFPHCVSSHRKICRVSPVLTYR